MQFRKDINGLRATAVIAVVLFHLAPSWVPGGFAGVDVFFVISGFLMTGIIFKGFEQGTFSYLNFLAARANRIVPALALLCVVLLVLGWFYLDPLAYKTLGKHAGSSVSFLSNIVYLRESGYFDADAHQKWLMHTWSLSVEWQFYVLYPLALVALRKYLSLQMLKKSVLVCAAVSFLLCIMETYSQPDSAFYLLPARAWEMLVGGIAYLYPLKLEKNSKKILEYLGLSLILSSYFLINESSAWPGYLALLPVTGSFFLIQAQREESWVTGNIVSQKLGAWSYSIYLWHWPLVVSIHYYSLSQDYVIGLAILLSIMLGFLSYRYVERTRFRVDFSTVFDYFRCKPFYMAAIVGILASFIFIENGFIKLSPPEYQSLISSARPSPFRNKCQVSTYQPAHLSCEYFGSNITWATLGDSHSTEIAYALAQKLEIDDVGLKQFSFSGCRPSYKESSSQNKCAAWYNEALNYILDDRRIRNVVLNHRFTTQVVGWSPIDYPNTRSSVITSEVVEKTKRLDELILELASNKDNVYVYYPIPELNKDIHQLAGIALRSGAQLYDISSTSLDWYKARNSYMIQHFAYAKYPSNVHLLKSQDVFCDELRCFAARDGVSLYFDNTHPSMAGAKKLVELIR